MSAPCDRFAAVTLAEAEGKMLSASDLAFRHQHCAACAACREEEKALSLLRLAEDGPAHFQTPVAERARTIDSILAAVDAVDAPDAVEPAPAAAPETDNVVPFTRRARRPAMWIAGIAAAAAALLLVVRVANPPARGPAPSARVLLASGGDLSAGAAAVEGQELSAAGGETSVALGSDIVILLDPGTKARLSKLQASGIEVALEAGRVHASVKPNTPGPRLAIATRDGRVEVTGTLFSVEARDGKSQLRVLRGSVKVSAPGRKTTAVTANQAQRLGSEELRALDREEQEAELAAMRRIGLLETAEASVLQIRSRPVGARVSLDGEAIGTTPLSAEVKTGHRHLVVASAGKSAEEWIDLHAGKIAIRDFDLAPPLAQADEPDAPAHRREIRRATPKAPVEEMLRKAQALRSQRDWAASAAAYRDLLATYPSASQTEAAWVSYGEILGDHLGEWKGALRACDSYLARAPGGVVAGEASACRIRALRALGRSADERAAIEEFLKRFPSAVQAPELERRLRSLP